MTTMTIRLPRAKRDDRGAHRAEIVMTTATIWVLQRLKPMTTATITGHARARVLICYGYSMTTAARSASRSASRAMTT
jgi:hypothetical protein